MKNPSRLDLSLLRGFRELSISETKVGKFIWFFLLLGVLGGCGYMMYTRVSLYLTAEEQVVLEPVNSPVKYPQISLCFSTNTLSNINGNSKLYAASVLNKNALLAIRMTANDALDLEKRVFTKMGLQFGQIYKQNILNTFGNLISNPTNPLAMMDFISHIMRPVNDYLLDCKYNGRPCIFQEVQIGPKTCININATDRIDSKHNRVSIWIRLNSDLIDDFNSSLANFQSGIALYVHETDTLTTMGNPRYVKSAVPINRPGIYDVTFDSKEGKLDSCNPSSENSFITFGNLTGAFTNASLNFIKDEEACIQSKFAAEVQTKCNCISPVTALSMSQMVQLVNAMMTGSGAPFCKGPGLAGFKFSIDAFKLGTAATAALGNWTRIKDQYFNALIGVVEGTGLTNDSRLDDAVIKAAAGIKCFSSLFDMNTGRPKSKYNCANFRRCKSLNYTAHYRYLPLPTLSSTSVSEMNARMINYRRQQALAQTGSVAVLGKSWASIPTFPTASYYQKNLAVINISPSKVPNRSLVTKKSTYTMEKLLLDLAFFLVFFLGFSVLSVFEFVDVMITLAFGKDAQKQNRNSRRTTNQKRQKAEEAQKEATNGKIDPEAGVIKENDPKVSE